MLHPSLLALAVALGLAGCRGSGYTLSFQNESGVPLQLVPLVSEPPPAHREVSTQTLAPGSELQLDAGGQDVMFYDPRSMLSVSVVIDWSLQFPTLTVRVQQHLVPPGEEGDEPGRQPRIVKEYPFEVRLKAERKQIEVRAGPVEQQLHVEIHQV